MVGHVPEEDETWVRAPLSFGEIHSRAPLEKVWCDGAGGFDSHPPQTGHWLGFNPARD